MITPDHYDIAVPFFCYYRLLSKEESPCLSNDCSLDQALQRSLPDKGVEFISAQNTVLFHD